MVCVCVCVCSDGTSMLRDLVLDKEKGFTYISDAGQDGAIITYDWQYSYARRLESAAMTADAAEGSRHTLWPSVTAIAFEPHDQRVYFTTPYATVSMRCAQALWTCALHSSTRRRCVLRRRPCCIPCLRGHCLIGFQATRHIRQTIFDAAQYVGMCVGGVVRR